MKKFVKSNPANQVQSTPIAKRLIEPSHMEQMRIALYRNGPQNANPYALEVRIKNDIRTGGWDTNEILLRNYLSGLYNIKYKVPSQWRESCQEWFSDAFKNAGEWEKNQPKTHLTLHCKLGARIRDEKNNERYNNIAGIFASVHIRPEPVVLLQIGDYDKDKKCFVKCIEEEFELTNKKQVSKNLTLNWEVFECRD
jgi:hypothetical protein